jgi:UDP-3-O-[3-hydroxymyristoyl] N-acetylglucosamine deacetylase
LSRPSRLQPPIAVPSASTSRAARTERAGKRSGIGIGRQNFHFAFSPANFRDLIAPARTFGFLKDLESLNRMNLARGASLENTLALDEQGVVNKERQRFADEFVRHKILDAIGDMALAGHALIARFEGVKSGHGLNNRLLRALFSDPANYELVTLP